MLLAGTMRVIRWSEQCMLRISGGLDAAGEWLGGKLVDGPLGRELVDGPLGREEEAVRLWWCRP
jgi:hypothetical protein